MGIIADYREYRKHLPEYKKWDEERKDTQSKRLAYIERNGLNAKTNSDDIQRAKAALAIDDVFDEYSQTESENRELAIQNIAKSIAQPVAYLGMGLGALIAFKTPFGAAIRSKIKDPTISAMILPIATSMLGGFGLSTAMSVWSADKEIKATTNGHFMAMENEEQTGWKQFVVLTPEQEKERDEKAKNITLTKKEAKKMNKSDQGRLDLFGFATTFREIKKMAIEDNKYAKKREEFNKGIEAEQANISNMSLSEQDILEAKKDEQLLETIHNEINKRSQDYAEEAEQACSIAETVLTTGGILGGFATAKIASLLKCSKKSSAIAGFVVGSIFPIIGAFYGTKIQKQASRVGRFKVKEELMANPEKLFYVDDEACKNEDGSKFKAKAKKKENIFQFIGRLYRENKEYNKYLKEKDLDQKKKMLAQNQMTFTPEQERRAKQFKHNTDKSFMKLDELSQKMCAGVEALGEIVQAGIGCVAGAYLALTTHKGIENAIPTGGGVTKWRNFMPSLSLDRFCLLAFQ